MESVLARVLNFEHCEWYKYIREISKVYRFDRTYVCFKIHSLIAQLSTLISESNELLTQKSQQLAKTRGLDQVLRSERECQPLRGSASHTHGRSWQPSFLLM